MTSWLAFAALTSSASAQETIELGRLSDDDITVVQQILHPKTDRSEIGVHLGLMPFDAFVFTPNLQVSYDMHSSEKMAIGLLVGGGYGIQNATSRQLQTPTYGVAPFAYRYLASALVGAQWSPIYAKMNVGGAKVVHFDIYFAGRGGVSLERSVIPDGSFALAPTVSPGIGSRFFLGDDTTLRVELRDDVLLERRALTSSWNLKQNAGVTVGLTKLSSRAPR
ncbi:MAG: outer membrane beta-barrel domain-containing protein [Alphaproteobacteria bacterium]|nr:outer membrane beta-barrel domain-containing protein [Alphaproteobacteria bacterium]MCB9692549.1 outer membrane beta-barrel domain-containing protein [Alphaproteobacteria bacterium]